MELFSNQEAMAVIFAGLMGLSILAYVILDGYDLGVGILMSRADDGEKDQMIASIGPFWDANETWLVLGVGLLLVAFPLAHGEILSALYIPTALMLVGLILRGVSFDFRAKARDKHKHLWDGAFIGGSLLASLSQGYMLGLYILGFETGLAAFAFGLLTGLCLVAGYVLVGASWLIMKTEGALQKRAIAWAKWGLWGTAAGMAMISLATPLASPRIFDKWFTLPNLLLLAPIPLMAMMLVALTAFTLAKLPKPEDRYAWVPFAGSVALFILGFQGLAYSFYPYLIPDRLTIVDAAAAPESLAIILVGALFVLPFIIGYTVFAYRVFWGKVQKLSYY
ncbi:cytochrome d ubiquinol oxidase subunit II [Rhizobium sp. RU36D]|uniref:cytochrome d ubiquinol oxidase subunit II n=1 Tax=Rhizobium sp. RU36D TaxID=1907415 RepID=UPI0009D867B6|nr:cytochrome d ubiquinol oxidase subunit II [Rhizobium sp. RU36D]SMC84686.1 cytochrome bd-I ubiquinol oxidase subunit 2 apoprotein [Rhizobium sp. RU36D]